ncbi:aspartic peptidase domain-containing protein [Fusarium acuminatum]|uniref:Aspartic peptidase domain-containing protein n=1 Tax=Fusarium acuminatum TaxID=5515 RepID=A0ABZ2X9L0_9HYPO
MKTATRFSSALIATTALAGAASAKVLDLPIIIKDGYNMVDFGVGEPAQHFQLLFDTGSASAWMVDAECAETCTHIDKGHRTGYNISASSTGKLTGQDASIGYIDGNLVAGPTVKEQFSAGGLTFEASFIAANESNWSSLAAAGFMGLSFGSIADGGAAPIFESLMAEKLMDEPRFGIYYSRADGDNTNGAPGKGVLTLGGSREDKYVDGDLITIDLTTGGNGDYDVWRSVLHTVTGSSKSSNSTKSKKQDFPMDGANIVFDTGASAIALPSGQLEEMYESIGMNWTAIINGEHIPLCSEFTDDWSITLQVGFYGSEKNLTITGTQMALPGFANREDACWPPFEETDSTGFSLIGTRLLKNFYTVWDYSAFPADGGFMSPKLSFGKLKAGY